MSTAKMRALGIAIAALGLPGCLVPPPATQAPPAQAPVASAPSSPTPGARASSRPTVAPPVADDEAHESGRWFPFPARGIGSPPGTVDLSDLNAAPAGSRGFIRAADGHFVEGSGARVRFFGVNCTATACFPTHDVATRAAAHLRRLGVNVVRLHFMDKGPAPIGLVTADRKALDPAQLDRLDFFVAELARNGIYVNLNLHVARRYPGLDGPAAQRFDMGKMLDRFYPPFVESQKDYARALLTHVNAYTGHAYAAEPAVLCVEMNNENTALPFWSGNLDDLPEPYSAELRRQWNVWLKGRYRTTERLIAGWKRKREHIAEIFSENMSAHAHGWTFESAGVPTRGEEIVTDDGGRGLRFTAERRGTASWHLQFYRAHLPLEEGEAYHVSFRVRAPPPNGARSLEVSTMLSVPDWRNLGLGRTIALGPDWRKVELSFRVQNTIEGEGRLNFSLRNVPGVVELADLTLDFGGVPVALAAGETLERGTIPLVRGEGGSPSGEDFLRFLADTDRATARTLARFLREELGLRSMLVDTQASYGGLEGLRRELAVSDFIDMHAYWQHPDFPSGWSALRFAIPNTTQVAAADGGALASLAVYRVAGKPFTVSEYNVPAPNDFASETLPMFAALGAFQDWDAIYAYTYLDFSPRWDADHLLGFFDLAGNPAALGFLPVAALTFRRGLVAPGRTVARLALPPLDPGASPLTTDGALARLWTAAGLAPSLLASRRMEIETVRAKPRSPASRSAGPGASSGSPGSGSADVPASAAAGELRWEPAAPAPRFTVVAPTLRVAAGTLAKQTLDLGDARVTVGDLPRGDASIALVALDGLPLETSKQVLLVSAARVENTGMRFSADRTGLVSWGRGPAVAEYVPLTVTMPWPRFRATRLDPAGVPAGELPVAVGADGRGILRLDHEPSLWFLLRR